MQIDVKFVPKSCLVCAAERDGFYQYACIDAYSRFRYREALQEHSAEEKYCTVNLNMASDELGDDQPQTIVREVANKMKNATID